jgi:hypothetical protein
VFVTFDRDLAYKIFGYRLNFVKQEMTSFETRGRPYCSFVWNKLNLQEQEDQDKDIEQNPEKYRCDEIKSTKNF